MCPAGSHRALGEQCVAVSPILICGGRNGSHSSLPDGVERGSGDLLQGVVLGRNGSEETRDGAVRCVGIVGRDERRGSEKWADGGGP